jgi:hypothetical protein
MIKISIDEEFGVLMAVNVNNVVFYNVIQCTHVNKYQHLRGGFSEMCLLVYQTTSCRVTSYHIPEEVKDELLIKFTHYVLLAAQITSADAVLNYLLLMLTLLEQFNTKY